MMKHPSDIAMPGTESYKYRYVAKGLTSSSIETLQCSKSERV